MRNKLGGLCLLTALVITSLAAPAMAGTTQPVKRVSTPKYDVSKEITLDGTWQVSRRLYPENCSAVIWFPHREPMHTSGPFALSGSHGVKVSPGQKVTLVGVMTTFHGSQVFLVRTVGIWRQDLYNSETAWVPLDPRS